MNRKLIDLGVRVQLKAYAKVRMARRLVTSSMTSRDSDVIAVTSHSSKSSHLEIRTQINYPFGPFKHKLSQNIVLK